MNCRRTRDLLTPYSDGRLTGAQMLEVAQHMDRCPGCRDEYRVIQEVKLLLRAVARPQPMGSLEREIQKRIATEEAISQINLCLSFSLRPQRAKRIATAMALSCFSVLVVAGPFGAGTLALTYSRNADKNAHSDGAHSHHQDLAALFGGSGINTGGLFASTSVPIIETPQYSKGRDRAYEAMDYNFMTTHSQNYNTSFASFNNGSVNLTGRP